MKAVCGVYPGAGGGGVTPLYGLSRGMFCPKGVVFSRFDYGHVSNRVWFLHSSPTLV